MFSSPRLACENLQVPPLLSVNVARPTHERASRAGPSPWEGRASLMPPSLECAVERGLYRYRYSIYGGAAGGVNSAIFVRIRQFRLLPPAAAGDSPEKLISHFALLLDAGGLCMPPEAIDEGDELLVLISHTHADHCSGIAALCSARDLGGRKTRIVLPAVGAERVRQTLALSELLGDASGSTRYKVIIQPVITAAAEPAQASLLDDDDDMVTMPPAPPPVLERSRLPGDPLATGGGIVLRPLELGESIAADGVRIIVPFPTVREPSLSASDCIRIPQHGFVWPCGCVSEWV